MILFRRREEPSWPVTETVYIRRVRPLDPFVVWAAE